MDKDFKKSPSTNTHTQEMLDYGVSNLYKKCLEYKSHHIFIRIDTTH